VTSRWSLILAIAVGSAVGGICRYVLGTVIQSAAHTAFPVGTLVINVTGCFVIGAILRFAIDTAAIGPVVRAFLTAGFCGGYTTFSSYSAESVRLIEAGTYGEAAAYLLGSVGLGLGATYAGFLVVRVALRSRRRADVQPVATPAPAPSPDREQP
jgi:CrcB protein